MSAEIPFELPENLVVMAGAGAGKTHALITIALHALAPGARGERAAVRASELCALTFTEKAAAEMKARLRRRIAVLADGGLLEEKERDLAAQYRRLDRPPPKPSQWAELLEAVPLAFVGTFHAFCAQLLRRWPLQTGFPVDFGLLDEREADARLERAIEATLFEYLDAKDARFEQARLLIRSLGFAADGDSLALREHLVSVARSVAEEGLEATSLLRRLPSEVQVEQGVELARREADLAHAVLVTHRGPPALDAVMETADGLIGAIRDGSVLSPTLEAAIAGIKLSHGPRTAKEAQKRWREALTGLRLARVAGEELKLCRAFVAVLADVEHRFAQGKQRDGVRDFTDLLAHTRTLLRDHPEIRSDTQLRLGALLIDEFQDTNPLQFELVSLLSERRDGAPRPLTSAASAFVELPLEPGFLAAVGDRKQSIYEFRGAEVSLITALATRLKTENVGRQVVLSTNWRSRPPLIRLFNRLFARTLAGVASHPFEVRYDPATDDLQAVREADASEPLAELLEVERTEDDPMSLLREREAMAVASRLARMLSPEEPPRIAEGDQLRRVRGGDVAILLRRYTHLDTFRRALSAHRVPFVVVQGRGFFGAQEVRDLAHLLRILGEPDDGIAWASVLRSPLVGLTDASLIRLVEASPTGLRAVADASFVAPRGLSEDERWSLARFRSLYARLEGNVDRLSPSGCVALAVDEVDLRPVLAAGLQGEQQVANVEKLIRWLARREKAGVRSAGELARELLDLAESESKEGHAAILEEGDVRAVRLMTVHQAKGLEFPVVFVPECGAGSATRYERVQYERELGLTIKPRDPRGRGIATLRSEEISARLAARAEAESLRLLYVGLTRAADYLVLSGETTSTRATWRSAIDGLLDGDPEARTVIRRVRVSAGDPGRHST